MGVLSALFRGSSGAYSNLITCILSPKKDGTWTATWVSDGRTPNDVAGHSLAEVVELTSHAVAELYNGRPEAMDAELQYAIYRFGNSTKYVLDIKKEPDGFSAHDLQNAGISFSFASLDELVSTAHAKLNNPSQTMFRWVRPVRELS
jgi:hypothetical protein